MLAISVSGIIDVEGFQRFSIKAPVKFCVFKIVVDWERLEYKCCYKYICLNEQKD